MFICNSRHWNLLSSPFSPTPTPSLAHTEQVISYQGLLNPEVFVSRQVLALHSGLDLTLCLDLLSAEMTGATHYAGCFSVLRQQLCVLGA